MGLRTSEKPRRDLDGDAGFYEREQLGYRPSEAGGGSLLCGSTSCISRVCSSSAVRGGTEEWDAHSRHLAEDHFRSRYFLMK